MTAPARTAAAPGLLGRAGRRSRAVGAAAVLALALGACSSPTAEQQLENREDERVDADSTPSATVDPVVPSANTGASGDPTPELVEPLPGSSDMFTPLPQASTTP